MPNTTDHRSTATFTAGTDWVLSGISPVSTLHVPGFLKSYGSDYADAVSEVLEHLSFEAYPGTVGAPTGEVYKFGPALFDHHGGKDWDRYFCLAAAADAQMAAAFEEAGVIDPRLVLIEVLRSAWGGTVKVASEGGRDYFHGICRATPSGIMTHVDNAALETPELAVGATCCQGSLLVFFECPDHGGETIIYRREGTLEDPLAGYGIDPTVVAGVAYEEVKPGRDSLLAFDTTRVHEVLPTTGSGRRLSISLFFGVSTTDSEVLLVWS